MKSANKGRGSDLDFDASGITSRIVVAHMLFFAILWSAHLNNEGKVKFGLLYSLFGTDR